MLIFLLFFVLVSYSLICQAWRAQLGRFGLSGSHQTAPIKQLSDGLRNRYVSTNLKIKMGIKIILPQCRIRTTRNGTSPYPLARCVLSPFSNLRNANKTMNLNIALFQMNLLIIQIWNLSMRLPRLLRNLRVELSLFHMISVSLFPRSLPTM